MTLGDYLRVGIQKFPRQIFFRAYQGTSGACAVGCLTWAIGRTGKTDTFGLDHKVACPVCVSASLQALRQALQTEISYRVGRGHELSVFDQIVHLNDQHRWSRERIAEWLDTLPAVGDLGRETLLAAQAA